MSKPTEHTFRGIRYRIHWRHPKGYGKDTFGSCQSPGAKSPTIEIDPRLKGFHKLNVIVDECLHGVLWDLDNDSVAECSEAIASFLWKCGYREVVDE